MSMHISAAPGEIAESVILPGDPLRAKYIAETYLTGAVRVNEIRNTWGYTGEYKGRRVSVMSTGMGAPSMLIYATELCREYGCKKLIRLGTAGAVQERIKLGDIVISQGVSTTSAINDYALPGHFSPLADFGLLYRAYDLAQERGLRAYVGNTLTNDHFYIDNKLEYSKQWERYGILASEQEGVALYTAAALYGARALLPLSDPEMQLAAAKTVIEKGLSVRRAEALAAQLLKDTQEKPAKKAAGVDYLGECARHLEQVLGRKVRIVSGKRKGRIELEYYGQDDLQQLYDALHTIRKKEQH